MNLEVRGAKQLARLSKQLDKGVKKDMTKALRVAAKPLVKKTRKVALEELPKGGGLNKRVAKAPQRITITPEGRVRISAGRSRSGAWGADKGEVRHPVFFRVPRQIVWAATKVTPGWFSKTIKEGAPEVRRELLVAMKEIGERITRGV